MIVRAMGLGFLLWLAIAVAFRFAGHYVFRPEMDTRLIVYVSAPLLGIVAGLVLMQVLREAPGDEGEAAIGLSFPALVLNAVAALEFDLAFPNLNTSTAPLFGAWTLLFVGAILFVGLWMTKLAPQDERV